MSRFELYSPEGLRVDGRRWDELRFFKCSLGSFAKSADGSSLVEMGTSKVVCTVRGPQEPESRSKSLATRATLSVSINVAPFATTERTKHTSNDRRLQELALNIRYAFEEAILLRLHPRTEIQCSINVLAQDGNLLPCCINAMTLALIDAGIPMLEYMSGVAVALSPDGARLLDPNQIETTELPSVNVGILGKNNSVQLLVVENRLRGDSLAGALELAIDGCKLIRELMDEEVRRHGQQRLDFVQDK